MSKTKLKAKKPTPTPKMKRTGRKETALPLKILLAFLCGTGSCLLAFVLFSFLMVQVSLPLSSVRLLACAAASVGTAVSGYVLATTVKQQRLLCGAGCGLFYCACLFTATCISQREISAAILASGLPASVFLSGLAGGALGALRRGN